MSKRSKNYSWNAEQVHYMLECADDGYTLEEASKEMIEKGWIKRTVPSLRSKYRSYTGSKWPNPVETIVRHSRDIEEVVTIIEPEEDEEEQIEKSSSIVTTMVLLLMGGLMLAYGWMQ